MLKIDEIFPFRKFKRPWFISVWATGDLFRQQFQPSLQYNRKEVCGSRTLSGCAYTITISLVLIVIKGKTNSWLIKLWISVFYWNITQRNKLVINGVYIWILMIIYLYKVWNINNDVLVFGLFFFLVFSDVTLNVTLSTCVSAGSV